MRRTPPALALAVTAVVLRRRPSRPFVQPVARAFYRGNLRGITFGGTQFEFFHEAENRWLAPER